jgi:hypothetical protein
MTTARPAPREERDVSEQPTDADVCTRCFRARRDHGPAMECPMPRHWYPVQDGETKETSWAGLDCHFTLDED